MISIKKFMCYFGLLQFLDHNRRLYVIKSEIYDIQREEKELFVILGVGRQN